jgi:hypothetical protein
MTVERSIVIVLKRSGTVLLYDLSGIVCWFFFSVVYNFFCAFVDFRFVAAQSICPLVVT